MSDSPLTAAKELLAAHTLPADQVRIVGSLVDALDQLTRGAGVEFFYTTEHPNRWDEGPQVFVSDRTGTLLTSLDHARACAQAAARGGDDASRCETTYGVRCAVEMP